MSDRPYVTIVSGLPRSGTSLMMKMLDQGGIPAVTDELREADEDNPKGYYEFEPVKKTKEDASWVPSAVGKVVKMVHLLLLDLPLDQQYRVVFMRRHMDEVIRSQNVMLERKGDNQGPLPPEKLKQIYLSQIKKVQDYVADHADHFQLLEVNYNQILEDAEPELKKVAAFLDDVDVNRMLEAIDPKLYRNRAGA